MICSTRQEPKFREALVLTLMQRVPRHAVGRVEFAELGFHDPNGKESMYSACDHVRGALCDAFNGVPFCMHIIKDTRNVHGD